MQSGTQAAGARYPVEALDTEERGILNEVVVPVLASGAGGAVSAAVSNGLQKKKEDK